RTRRLNRPVGSTHGYFIRPFQGRTRRLKSSRGFHPRLFHSTLSGSDAAVEIVPWVSPTAISFYPFKVGRDALILPWVLPTAISFDPFRVGAAGKWRQIHLGACVPGGPRLIIYFFSAISADLCVSALRPLAIPRRLDFEQSAIRILDAHIRRLAAQRRG